MGDRERERERSQAGWRGLTEKVPSAGRFYECPRPPSAVSRGRKLEITVGDRRLTLTSEENNWEMKSALSPPQANRPKYAHALPGLKA